MVQVKMLLLVACADTILEERSQIATIGKIRKLILESVK